MQFTLATIVSILAAAAMAQPVSQEVGVGKPGTKNPKDGTTCKVRLGTGKCKNGLCVLDPLVALQPQSAAECRT